VSCFGGRRSLGLAPVRLRVAREYGSRAKRPSLARFRGRGVRRRRDRAGVRSARERRASWSSKVPGGARRWSAFRADGRATTTPAKPTVDRPACCATWSLHARRSTSSRRQIATGLIEFMRGVAGDDAAGRRVQRVSWPPTCPVLQRERLRGVHQRRAYDVPTAYLRRGRFSRAGHVCGSRRSQRAPVSGWEGLVAPRRRPRPTCLFRHGDRAGAGSGHWLISDYHPHKRS